MGKKNFRVLSSAGSERRPYKAEVAGSIPAAPTNEDPAFLRDFQFNYRSFHPWIKLVFSSVGSERPVTFQRNETGKSQVSRFNYFETGQHPRELDRESQAICTQHISSGAINSKNIISVTPIIFHDKL